MINDINDYMINDCVDEQYIIISLNQLTSGVFLPLVANGEILRTFLIVELCVTVSYKVQMTILECDTNH